MNVGTLALLLPLATANPPKMVATPAAPMACAAPGCATPTMALPTPSYPTVRPYPGVCPPLGPPAPVLMVKLIPPAGTRTTLLPGTPVARIYTDAVTVGFRHGYVYRVQLDGLPNRPGEVLFPEIEVRGSLIPRNGMNVFDYPAALVFTAADVEKASTGSLVTKVVYLEDPMNAVPLRTTPDRPYEETLATAEDAVQAAIDHGRPVMIVRLGNRKPNAESLARVAVPGTVLLPGEPALPLPASPPYLGWFGVPLFDPILGPKSPGEECLTDGGDRATPLGIGPDGKVRGLDTTDVAADYLQGTKRKVTTSNRVCLCVPRFSVYRADVGIGGLQFATKLNAETQAFVTSTLAQKLPVLALGARVKPVGYEARMRAMAQVSAAHTHTLIGPLLRPAAIAVTNGLQIVASAVEPDELTNLPNELIVVKSIDPNAGVKVGDEVTITIKYENRTQQTVTELVVSDNLTTRLEFVPGTTQSDRPANVTTETNASGSAVVRFAIVGSVAPGQGGVVKFKARVR